MSTARRDPSFVDRQRLDSDVRAFLRQPSTPWMVFDREDGSTPPPEPEQPPFVGAVLEGSGSSIVQRPGFFPTHDAYAPEPAPSETSTAAVVSEILDEPARPRQHAELDFDLRPKRRWAAIAGIGSVALAFAAITVGLVAMHGGSSASTDAKPRDTSVAAAGMKSLPIDTLPPDLDPKPAVEEKKEKAPEAPVTPAKPTTKFGKLTIAGNAAFRHQVYMDGKRFLGTGVRSFTVMCGSHAIGIDSRTDTQDREVPCGGELVVSE